MECKVGEEFRMSKGGWKEKEIKLLQWTVLNYAFQNKKRVTEFVIICYICRDPPIGTM